MAAKDYKNLSRPTLERAGKESAAPGNSAPLTAFFSGLGLGLLIALGLYITIPGAIPGHGARKAADEQRPAAREKEQQTAAAQDDLQSDQSRYDFYSILTERDVSISEWEAEGSEDANGGLEQERVPGAGLLILQIGSFLTFEAANQMKTQLARTGIQSNIQRVVINGQEIRYRVRTSPYQDRERLRAARKQLVDNNIDYILLTLRTQQ